MSEAKIKSLADIRRDLSRTYRQLEAGTIDCKTAHEREKTSDNDLEAELTRFMAELTPAERAKFTKWPTPTLTTDQDPLGAPQLMPTTPANPERLTRIDERQITFIMLPGAAGIVGKVTEVPPQGPRQRLCRLSVCR